MLMTTLMAVVPSTGLRVTVADSSEWCDLWGMKLNAGKTKTDSLQVTHSASPDTPINYWPNCTERV